MSQTVGTIRVDLQANTASFTGNLGKAAGDARRAGSEIKGAFGGLGGTFSDLQGSTGEARHAIMLLGEETGVHVPRAVAGLIASIGPLQGILSAAFPILGAVALFEIVNKLIEKHKAYLEAVQKAKEETAALTIKESDRAEGLRVANLRLEDEIAKLENRPAKNTLAIALAEAQIKANELATALQGDIEKSIELLDKGPEESLGKLKTWKSAIGLDDFSTENAALENVRTTIDMVTEARLKMSEPNQNEAQQKANILALKDAYGQLRSAASTALTQVMQDEPDNAKQIENLKRVILSANFGAIDMNETLKSLALTVTKVGDESAVAAQEGINKLVEKTNELRKATEGILGKGDSPQVKQIREIDALIDKWREYATEFPKAYQIANQHIAELERQRTLDVEQETRRQRLLQMGVIEGLEPEQKKVLDAIIKDKEKEVSDWLKLEETKAKGGISLAQEQYKTTVEQINAEYNAHKISLAQRTAEEKQALNEEYEAELKQEEKLLMLYQNDPVKVQEVQDKIKAIKLKHTADITKIDDEAQKQSNETLAKFGEEIGNQIKAGILFGRSWHDIFKTLIVDLLELILKMEVFKTVAGSSSGSGGGVLSSLLGGLFGGGKAGGGDIDPGKVYMTGESGPELIVPRGPMSVIPSSATSRMGGGGDVYNIDARGADVAAIQRLERMITQSKFEAVSLSVATVRERDRRRAS